MSFLVGKNWVDKCCNERGITVVASVSETEESGEEAGDDEDGEQDDEGGGEGWGGHTDVALFFMKRLSHWRIDVNNSVITTFLDIEGKVSAGDDMDDLLDTNISHAVGLLLADITSDEAEG